jgi:hypothetical protein
VTWIGKLWTAGIAYVALAVGAGLSIMYNVVDTATVRGPAMDTYDLVTAIAAPGIVVLMVELFVSNWWIGTQWPMQVLRWSGCLVIGGVAMRASWTHGHDFMVGRGQTADVATTWPLAIDLLAVMATALILAGRRVRGQLSDTDIRQRVAMTAPDVATFKEKMSADRYPAGGFLKQVRADMATPTATDMSADNWTDDGHGHEAADCADMDIHWSADTDLMSWADGHDRAVTDMGQELATEAERYVREVMSADTMPTRTRTASRRSAPAEFVAMATAWDPIELDRADMVKLSAAYFDVSTRTVRRWLSAVSGGDQ